MVAENSLDSLLNEAPKAQLQGFYLHWFPGKDLLSSKDRLRSDLVSAMTDMNTVRQRFDSLNRSQKAFLSSLLSNGTATVDEICSGKHGRTIEHYEIESLLKMLQEAGYVVRENHLQNGEDEIFSIPAELANAMKGTVALDDRVPLQLLSAQYRNGGAGESKTPSVEDAFSVSDRVDSIDDPVLRSVVESAIHEYGGILTLRECNERGLLGSPESDAGLQRADWTQKLESLGLGTTGVVSLREYGIDLEEQALVLYQERVHESCIQRAESGFSENDREIALGADLMIDLDRLPELLRQEVPCLTRDGRVYKKVEDKLRDQLVVSNHQELIASSPVHHLFGIARRLRILEQDGQRVVLDRVGHRIWRRTSLADKVHKVFEIFFAEKGNQHWSFHQERLREIFLEELQRRTPGAWLVAKSFVSAVVARYLLSLESSNVRDEYERRLQDDFKNRPLVVTLATLHRDLSYWLFHRLALLGLVDVGYLDGAFYSFRLSRMGCRFFDLGAQMGYTDGPQLLLNPDLEALVYPEAPEEWSWTISQFADRQDSDLVKRYQITRESVKRAVSSGWTSKEIVDFLRLNAYGVLPPNVLFCIREWSQGVEFIRKRRVLLLRARTKTGSERLAEVLEKRQVEFERLSETSVVVHGVKNEQSVNEMQAEFRDWGLIVE